MRHGSAPGWQRTTAQAAVMETRPGRIAPPPRTAGRASRGPGDGGGGLPGQDPKGTLWELPRATAVHRQGMDAKETRSAAGGGTRHELTTPTPARHKGDHPCRERQRCPPAVAQRQLHRGTHRQSLRKKKREHTKAVKERGPPRTAPTPTPRATPARAWKEAAAPSRGRPPTGAPHDQRPPPPFWRRRGTGNRAQARGDDIRWQAGAAADRLRPATVHAGHPRGRAVVRGEALLGRVQGKPGAHPTPARQVEQVAKALTPVSPLGFSSRACPCYR